MQKKLNQVWRRRRCQSCAATFSTHEAADYSALWRVKTMDGRLTPFLRDKLFLSLLASCKHRTTALTDARALADAITSGLQPPLGDSVIPVTTIVGSVQVALNRFDAAASVHYSAFHPQ